MTIVIKIIKVILDLLIRGLEILEDIVNQYTTETESADDDSAI